jgi:hypothetical protein
MYPLPLLQQLAATWYTENTHMHTHSLTHCHLHTRIHICPLRRHPRADLALAVIDEEQRFGVHQREQLVTGKGGTGTLAATAITNGASVGKGGGGTLAAATATANGASGGVSVGKGGGGTLAAATTAAAITNGASGVMGSGGGAMCHVLYMSATPTPRTLSLTAFGDIDVGVLREKPRGAVASVQTTLASLSKLDDVSTLCYSSRNLNTFLRVYVLS